MTTETALSKNEILVIVICFALIVGVCFNALFPYGELRMTYDSQMLVEASKSFHTYFTEKNTDGHSYLVRAPLHPFLLSFFYNKMPAMWWINVVSLLASLYFVYRICRLNGLSTHLSLGSGTVILAFYPWLMNFQFFWTEPVFILLILCLCYSLLKNQHVVYTILICLLLFLTRKPGIFFFPACATFYLLDKKQVNALITLVSGVMFFIAWQGLEYINGSTGYFGTMLGNLDNFSRIFYLDAVTSWFVPMGIPLLFRSLLVLLISIVILYSFRKELFPEIQRRQNVILLSIGGVYTLIFISFSGTTGYEDAERYLNVVFPLWIIVAVSLMHRIIPAATKSQRIFILMGVGLWLLYTFARTAHHLL